MLYAFGSDYWGCIGCNNELDEEVVTPYRVRFFDDNPVEQVACGECHVVALTGGLPVSCGSWRQYTLMLSELTFLYRAIFFSEANSYHTLHAVFLQLIVFRQLEPL